MSLVCPRSHCFTTFASALSQCWTGADHQSVLWCRQAVYSVLRALRAQGFGPSLLPLSERLEALSETLVGPTATADAQRPPSGARDDADLAAADAVPHRATAPDSAPIHMVVSLGPGGGAVRAYARGPRGTPTPLLSVWAGRSPDDVTGVSAALMPLPHPSDGSLAVLLEVSTPEPFIVIEVPPRCSLVVERGSADDEAPIEVPLASPWSLWVSSVALPAARGRLAQTWRLPAPLGSSLVGGALVVRDDPQCAPLVLQRSVSAFEEVKVNGRFDAPVPIVPHGVNAPHGYLYGDLEGGAPYVLVTLLRDPFCTTAPQLDVHIDAFNTLAQVARRYALAIIVLPLSLAVGVVGYQLRWRVRNRDVPSFRAVVARDILRRAPLFALAAAALCALQTHAVLPEALQAWRYQVLLGRDETVLLLPVLLLLAIGVLLIVSVLIELVVLVLAAPAYALVLIKRGRRSTDEGTDEAGASGVGPASVAVAVAAALAAVAVAVPYHVAFGLVVLVHLVTCVRSAVATWVFRGDAHAQAHRVHVGLLVVLALMLIGTAPLSAGWFRSARPLDDEWPLWMLPHEWPWHAGESTWLSSNVGALMNAFAPHDRDPLALAPFIALVASAMALTRVGKGSSGKGTGAVLVRVVQAIAVFMVGRAVVVPYVLFYAVAAAALAITSILVSEM